MTNEERQSSQSTATTYVTSVDATTQGITTTAWWGWCGECGLPFNNHYVGCSKADTVEPAIEGDPE